ncbi:unnamed protein product [Spirodela intermedia]|uniref:RING-type domain-containing protein n=1 Tax=Spirodela intermedia TaxID=51605 RepID=A0A7I8JES6_SPIIN|nr:unnamed protein product [Spirodela intermedia]CAA6668668.1 unnamed protein product [Spirodela intermedia]
MARRMPMEHGNWGEGGTAASFRRELKEIVKDRMWRELEADAGQVHSPPSGGVSRGENLVPLSKGDFSSGEESCGRTEACDGSKWEPEHIGPNKSSGGSSDGAKELSLDIVKTHSSEFEIRNYPANCCENKEYLAHEEFADGAFLRGTIHHFMGWKKIDNLLARMRQERQSELNKLKLNYHVSRFSHRSWIQALLRFRHADRLLRIAHQQFRDSTDLELDSLRQRGSTIWFLREKFSPRNQHTINADQVVGASSHMGDKSTIASKGDQEATATRDFKSMLKKENTPHSTGEGPQENIQSSALSQQKGILEITNISCERATDSSNLDNEVEHLATENFEHASLNSVDGCDGTWTSDGSQGKIEWQCQGRSVSPHLNKSYPETTEIHELLLRKPVSTSLTSNFRKTMDRLVLSLLQKQQSMCQAYEDEELLPSQRINGESIDADEVTSSLSIMPLSFQKFHRPEDHQESCITSQPSHQFHDVELIHDLRSDVAEIHQEIVELRILLKNCVDEHSKLKSLIRDEVSSMCLSSVGISMALQASRWAPAKRGHCCICHQVPIDTLLYRCGHMCSCYRCAQELRWGAGICPVCTGQMV